MVLSPCKIIGLRAGVWALVQPLSLWHPERWSALQVKLLSCVPLALLRVEISSPILSALEAAISEFDLDSRKCSGLSTCHLALVYVSMTKLYLDKNQWYLVNVDKPCRKCKGKIWNKIMVKFWLNELGAFLFLSNVIKFYCVLLLCFRWTRDWNAHIFLCCL